MRKRKKTYRLDELDAMHAAAMTAVARAGDRTRENEAEAVLALEAISAALYAAWPAFSARLRAKEVEVGRLRGALRNLHAVVTGDVPAREMLDAMHAARAALGEP